ncbi:hypothetical protein GGS21DRAFT_397723 [Xylaria nigripes]|nr:hypothetical protein GGS21DRAFT_397723 [Xylaria nigripes]
MAGVLFLFFLPFFLLLFFLIFIFPIFLSSTKKKGTEKKGGGARRPFLFSLPPSSLSPPFFSSQDALVSSHLFVLEPELVPGYFTMKEYIA